MLPPREKQQFLLQRWSQPQRVHDLRYALSRASSKDFTFGLQAELECRILAITDEPANNEVHETMAFYLNPRHGPNS